MKSVTPLLILGAGEFALELAGLVNDIEGFEVAGFVQNVDPAKRYPTLQGLPVLWVDEVRGLSATHWAVSAVSSVKRRRFVGQIAEMGIRFATLVHPKAHVSRATELGEGTIIGPGAMIASHCRIGRHVKINRGALIGHHTAIGDYATLGPGANIAGMVTIGEATFVGIGAIVSDHLRIGARCFLTAGAVVTADVDDDTKVVTAITRAIPQPPFP